MTQTTGSLAPRESSIRRLRRGLLTAARSEEALLHVLALLVGLAAGLAALAFSHLTDLVRSASLQGVSGPLGILGEYSVILLPAAGGLLCGLLVHFGARGTKGLGIPEVMEAVALRAGRLKARIVFVRVLASALTIGSGGAAGKEGPVVQLGSALGSLAGRFMRASERRTRTLVACGAAAGIAATFNAPMAGVLFSLEVILGEFTVGRFGNVVVAAVAASVVTRVFVGDVAAFAVPEYALESPAELGLYVLLGLIAAVLAAGFARAFYWSDDLFNALPGPEFLKPALGGLAVGLIGLAFPQVLGIGYESIESALHGEVLLQTAAALVLVKMAATSLSLGSGGAGGVFAPCLFAGAMLGNAFGDVVNRVMPEGLTAPAGAYAVAGMAAFFSAASQAPISTVVILFEMTGDYRLILPLMLTTVVATLAGRAINPDSIYAMKLARRGTRLVEGRSVDIMEGVQVSEVMSDDTESASPQMSLESLAALLERTHRQTMPVVGPQGELLALVSVEDLNWALRDLGDASRTISEIASQDIVSVHPDESMWTALSRMAPRDLNALPVVDRADPKKLLGMIRHADIVRAYKLAIVRKSEIRQRLERMRVELESPDDASFLEVAVGARSIASGKTLARLELPRDSVAVSIRRAGRTIIPRGDISLARGDRVMLFAQKSSHSKIVKLFESRKKS